MGIAGLVVPALVLAAGCLVLPAAMRAAPGNSAEITRLLGDARAEAAALKLDAADMEAFTRMKASWQSYAGKVEMVKGHVNATGKLLASLKNVEAEGSSWQQMAIRQIEPYLSELAANTEATINHLNENTGRVHMPDFKNYVKANLDLASNLDALIRDFVNYGEAKQKFEDIAAKREIS